MRIINSEKWSVTTSGTKDFIFNTNSVGDTVASELYVNPLSDCTVVVKGYVGPDDTTGVELAATNIATYEVEQAVSTAGDYMYITGSFYKVNISVTGTSDILIKYMF